MSLSEETFRSPLLPRGPPAGGPGCCRGPSSRPTPRPRRRPTARRRPFSGSADMLNSKKMITTIISIIVVHVIIIVYIRIIVYSIKVFALRSGRRAPREFPRRFAEPTSDAGDWELDACNTASHAGTRPLRRFVSRKSGLPKYDRTWSHRQVAIENVLNQVPSILCHCRCRFN